MELGRVLNELGGDGQNWVDVDGSGWMWVDVGAWLVVPTFKTP